MTDAEEPGREVSVTAKIDEAGLTASARSRAISAVDNLVGTAFDIPKEWLKGKVQRIRQQNKTQEVLASVEREAAVNALSELPELGQRTVTRFLGSEMRKQENLEAIAVQTVEGLKQLPPPTDDEVQDESEELDPDWMNVFEGYAGNATSEHLRTLWARVLAGEIRKPASFSRTTLRLVSEIDQPIAEIFERNIELLFEERSLMILSDLEGSELLDLLFLEEVGLLQDVTGKIGRDYNASDGLQGIVNRSKVLLFNLQSNIRVNFVPLTRAGREIASIIPRATDDHILRMIYQHFGAQMRDSRVATVIDHDGSNVRWTNETELN